MLAALVAVALHRWLDLSVVTGTLLVAGWIVKDLVLYPWLRDAYAGDARSPKDELVGQTGAVIEPLRPVGVVRLRAELWRAEVTPEHSHVPRGRQVRVREVRGLTLVVAPLGDEAGRHGRGEAALSTARAGRGSRD